jgi:hypothetical protein
MVTGTRAIMEMKLNTWITNRIIIFFFAFSDRDESLKLKSSDMEYLILGNFKSKFLFFFCDVLKNYILAYCKYNYWK